jgi:hypothetical protein
MDWMYVEIHKNYETKNNSGKPFAISHQVLDEISRNSCQNKEKEEHSNYNDYCEY